MFPGNCQWTANPISCLLQGTAADASREVANHADILLRFLCGWLSLKVIFVPLELETIYLNIKTWLQTPKVNHKFCISWRKPYHGKTVRKLVIPNFRIPLPFLNQYPLQRPCEESLKKNFVDLPFWLTIHILLMFSPNIVQFWVWNHNDSIIIYIINDIILKQTSY